MHTPDSPEERAAAQTHARSAAPAPAEAQQPGPANAQGSLDGGLPSPGTVVDVAIGMLGNHPSMRGLRVCIIAYPVGAPHMPAIAGTAPPDELGFALQHAQKLLANAARQQPAAGLVIASPSDVAALRAAAGRPLTH